MRGFSLIEIITVIGIFALLIGIGLPLGIDTYRNFLLSTEVKNFLSILRRAENFALANEGSASHGVFIQNDKFILFRGNSFANRSISFDELYDRAVSVTVSGPQEVVFTPLSGVPNASSTWILSSGASTQTIALNEQGAINW